MLRSNSPPHVIETDERLLTPVPDALGGKVGLQNLLPCVHGEDRHIAIFAVDEHQVPRFDVAQTVEHVRSLLGVDVTEKHGRSVGARGRSQLVPGGFPEGGHFRDALFEKTHLHENRVDLDGRDGHPHGSGDHVSMDGYSGGRNRSRSAGRWSAAVLVDGGAVLADVVDEDGGAPPEVVADDGVSREAMAVKVGATTATACDSRRRTAPLVAATTKARVRKRTASLLRRRRRLAA